MHNRCDLRQRQHESNFAHTKIAYGEEEIETVGRKRFRLKKGFEKTQNSPIRGYSQIHFVLNLFSDLDPSVTARLADKCGRAKLSPSQLPHLLLYQDP